MLKALAIARNDLACYAKNRMAIFWTFLGPAVCMWFFGFLTPSSTGLAPVTVIDHQPQSKFAAALISTLRRNGHFVSESGQVAKGGLTLELGGAALAGQAFPAIVLHSGPRESEAERTLRFEVAAAMTGPTQTANGSLVKLAFPATTTRASGGFQRTVPAYLIMFLTMNLLMSGAGFSAERASGRLRRLLTAPLAAGSVIAGRLASRLVVAWFQMLLLFSIGVFALGIHWADRPAGVIILLSFYVLAMGSVGILIGAHFRDPDQASAFAMWTALLLAPLTGLWWPIELMPRALQVLGQCLPTGWVMQCVNAMLVSGVGVTQFSFALAGLAAVAAAAIWLSVRRLPQH